MAICSKTFTMTVAPAMTGPDIYYKMDALTGGNELIDSVDSANLFNSNNCFSIDPAGFRVACGQQTAFTMTGNTLAYKTHPYYDMSALTVGMTLRLWYKCANPASTPSLIAIVSNNAFSHYASADFILYKNSSKWSARFDYDLAHEVATVGTIPADTNWHRLIVWVDIVATVCGIQLDDLAPVVSAAGLDVSSWWGDSRMFFGTISGTGTNLIYLDEIGYWHEHVMTAAERLADWNGGAGITWPEGV